jgi:hypothetical protein
MSSLPAKNSSVPSHPARPLNAPSKSDAVALRLSGLGRRSAGNLIHVDVSAKRLVAPERIPCMTQRYGGGSEGLRRGVTLTQQRFGRKIETRLLPSRSAMWL